MIQTTDVAQAANLLSASFADYPVFRYIVPEGSRRDGKLASVFAFLVRLALANGEVIAPTERIEGVSIWLRSERGQSSALGAFRAGLLGLYLNVGHGAVSRLLQVATAKTTTATVNVPMQMGETTGTAAAGSV